MKYFFNIFSNESRLHKKDFRLTPVYPFTRKRANKKKTKESFSAVIIALQW